MRRLAVIIVVAGWLGGCGSPDPQPEPTPAEPGGPVATGPTRDVPELGHPRPKLLPPEASAGGRE